MSKVIILNGMDDDGGEMALYVDDVLIAEVTIDGSNDCPDSVLDYLNEFGVTPSAAGITDLAVAEAEPFAVTEGRVLNEEEDEDSDTYDDDYSPFPKKLTAKDYADYKIDG